MGLERARTPCRGRSRRARRSRPRRRARRRGGPRRGGRTRRRRHGAAWPPPARAPAHRRPGSRRRPPAAPSAPRRPDAAPRRSRRRAARGAARPTCQRATCQRSTGTGGRGSASGGPCTTAAWQRRPASAATALPVLARTPTTRRALRAATSDAARPRAGSQPEHQQPVGRRAGEQRDAAGGDAPVGDRPATAGGHRPLDRRGRDHVADPRGDDARALREVLAERRACRGRRVAEQLLDRGAEGPREAERPLDGRRVATGLDGRHELPADARTVGELGLGQPECLAQVADRRARSSCMPGS